jgi:DNA-binding MarR family transcriptional regulator
LRALPTWLLGQSAAQGHRLVAERMYAAHVGHRSHYSLLAALEETGPTSQADLGRRIGLDPSDVTAAMTHLENQGFVERTPDPQDKRRNLVSITASGLGHLREIDAVVGKSQDELLEPLSAQERRELIRMLQRVIEHHVPDEA